MVGDTTTSSGRALVVFDFETNSLSPANGSVVQVAACHYDPGSGEIRGSYERLVNPGAGGIPVRCSKIHGVWPKHVKGKPLWRDMSPEFWGWLLSCPPGPGGDVVLVGYNSRKFDVPFLLHETARALRAGALHDTVRGELRALDLLPVARAALPELANHRQGTVYEHLFGKEIAGAHTAMGDVVALASILKHPRIQAQLAIHDPTYNVLEVHSGIFPQQLLGAGSRSRLAMEAFCARIV